VLILGLDPDPVGATIVVVQPAGEAFRLVRWGLVRPPDAPSQHAYQITPEELQSLLPGAVVGVEVIEKLFSPAREEQARLQATRQMGQHLADLAEQTALVCYTFPGCFRGQEEERFTEGPWPSRLTGLRYPGAKDVRREIRQQVPTIARWLSNPHVRDALGVALLAARLARREGRWTAC
jgi:hypothetical protein